MARNVRLPTRTTMSASEIELTYDDDDPLSQSYQRPADVMHVRPIFCPLLVRIRESLGTCHHSSSSYCEWTRLRSAWRGAREQPERLAIREQTLLSLKTRVRFAYLFLLDRPMSSVVSSYLLFAMTMKA